MVDDRRWAFDVLLPEGIGFRPTSVPRWAGESFAERQGDSQDRIALLTGDLASISTAELGAAEAVVVLGPGRNDPDRLRRLGFQTVGCYVALPSLRHPKLYVPLLTPSTASAALGLYTPERLAARALHAATRALLRAGVGPALPGQLLVASRTPSLLESALPKALSKGAQAFAVSPGTPGPARKVTVGLLSRTGELVAVAKSGASRRARDLITHEAGVLRTLVERPDVAGLSPRLITCSDIGDSTVLVQSALPGKPSGVRFSQAKRRLLDRLASGPPRPALATAVVRQLPARLAANQLPGISTDDLVAMVHRGLSDAMVPATIVHGDFAPWNLRADGDTVRAFDWEYALTDGLPLMDELHHRVQVALLIDKVDDQGLVRLVHRTIHDAGIPLAQGHGLALVYLVHSLLQAMEDGKPVSDPSLQPRLSLMRSIVAQIQDDRP